uniref:Putative ovule protein n=1 Tax=Solanum chacoense TaxID=4108 RepID=A0A0V0HSG0_SOLCH
MKLKFQYTDLVAEAIAIREGLQCCLENNFPNIIIETDSLALVHMLKGEWEIPWNVTMEVNSINRLRNSMSVRVQHSLREGFTLADFFANLVFLFVGTYEFRSLQEVPIRPRELSS